MPDRSVPRRVAEDRGFLGKRNTQKTERRSGKRPNASPRKLVRK